MIAWVFLVLLIIFELVADVLAKEYSLKGKLILGGLSLFFFIVANTCWLVSLRHKSQLAAGANIFSVSTGVIAVFIGAYLYGEAITPQQYAGVVLGIVALVLLVW